MLFVLILAGVILGIGHLMGAPWRARGYMVGLLFVAVLAVQVALPAGHPLREGTGGSPAPWLLLAGGVALILAYRAVLQRIRERAEAAEQARAAPPAPQGPFTSDELERYARHITLPDIGGRGQKALKEAKVLVVGAGGLGSPALLYLAAAGVGTIGVIDNDEVDLSNLQRQIIHSDQRQEMPKVFSAEIAIKALNPFVTVKPYHRRLTDEIAVELFAEYDLILDGTDSYATRDLINRAAQASGRPVMAGAISAWEGQVTLYDPAGGAPCFACIFPDAPGPGMAATCSETGVIGALPGVIGTMMALEAIKEITGAGEGLRGRMLIYDALYAETRIIRLKRRADCAVCGQD
ncbi:molybdopterin-synthase adenylyltransferase MoeB [Roseobacter sp. HKCCD9010]|uniref:HesA/MoeB/ThiF family protein n=1 Tax=unclassified Roseobacter TaxID=196798 RepID=UPI001491F7C0|nr:MULTISPECIES: HesA/MoeB/ThiF family protein [unclassified Roseobacter]MBF9049068.1 molybdopterin-synthase adenylyltransferase MoeB [Rhodobacterales bacterium HKCCD4356]NNV11068.1 molybdopterin-synthase adenylyltransferase MoeB [Roseobacter sp. HKCCD7357]NNV15252.1 molybdopterin-synthase adenylyltransferase MoeB [Roseobacter sp. HKCCD8768]NNV24712.1 molybdopterin-synthase adenylyltransferase MoeB [Roseobacter sp. HKCCD8192]NNV28968.1 molybdopterin-synthase adenylyltransferase MoeB [Roseobact